MKIYLCVSIDCECDKGPGWRLQKPLSFSGVYEGIANRLGVPMVALRDFIKLGVASASLAHRIGTSMAAAEDLAQAVGAEGRVGVVVGLLLGASGERSKAVGN